MRALLCALGSIAIASNALAADEGSDRQQLRFEFDAGFIRSDSSLGSWTKGGIGKLRYSEDEDGLNAARIFAEYRARLSPAWSTTVVMDYVDDASSGLDLTEAFVDWRPIPKSGVQQQVRLGAFYPPLSLENSTLGWQSPYTYSYSAIDTWLGEEVRPIGAEWSMRKRIGFAGSPHELRAFASVFYANDPAGTLLFYRGWSLHDRQTRLNDKLPMPSMPIWNQTGTIVGYRAQAVEPIEEIDDRPGAYAGVEWRYARRVLVQLARWDNRADPWAFRDGQWAWHTKFTHIGVQASLPWEVGFAAQWLDGATSWVQGAGPTGFISPFAELVQDDLRAKYLLLTRVFSSAHRVSLRRDEFSVWRDGAVPASYSDEGTAWTLSYRYERSNRLSAGVEWLRVTSDRDLWQDFYGADEHAVERTLRLQISYRLGIPAAR